MCSLFLCAQDISSITLALLEDDVFLCEETFAVSPEKYLATVDQFLHEHKKSSEDMDRIIVVNGPGSFTAIRMSVMIANTIAFVRDIPVIPVQNPEYFSLRHLRNQMDREKKQLFAIPVYDRDPHIT